MDVFLKIPCLVNGSFTVVRKLMEIEKNIELGLFHAFPMFHRN